MMQSISLPLKPLPGFEWSSLTGNVASAAAYYTRDYAYAFADAWSFSPFKESNIVNAATLGQESVLYGTSYEQILEVSQIRYHIHHHLPTEEALGLIRLELAQNRPVLVKTNTFWCPWFPSDYHRLHRPHFHLITGYDDLSNHLFCTDVAYGTYCHPQSVSDFSLGFTGELMTLQPANDEYPNTPELPNLYSVLFRRAEHHLGLGKGNALIFDSMRYMADHFDEWDRLSIVQQEQEGPDTMNRLNLELLYIVQSRMQFVHLLNQQRDEEDHIIEQFVFALTQSIRSWSLIRTTYVNSFEPRIRRDSILATISDQIRVAAALEEDIAHAIMHVKQLQQVSKRYQQRTSQLS